MGDRHGTLLLSDLFTETGDNRPIATWNIAKAGRTKRVTPHLSSLDRKAQALYIDFYQALAKHPMMFVGFTALSVPIITNFSTP